MIQQNASSAEELSATAEELSGQAEQLQAAMGYFKLDDEESAKVKTPYQTARGGESASTSRHELGSFLERAIRVHQDWKHKLMNVIDGGAIPNKAIVCSDNRCDLGVWIYSDGKMFEGTAEYTSLREGHARFHTSIGRIMDLIVAGKILEVKRNLTDGEFAKYSGETVAEIIKMRMTLGKSRGCKSAKMLPLRESESGMADVQDSQFERY